MRITKDNPPPDLLIEEYKQAWDHFRHMENARTNYINFYFTALFAIFGLYSALLTLDLLKVGEIHIMMGISLLNIFSIFTLYIYINIVRIGWVLNGYSNVIRELRKLMHSDTFLQKNISVRDYLPSGQKKNFFSIQYSAQILLQSFMVIVNILILISIVIYMEKLVVWKLILLLILWIAILAIEVLSIINAKKYQLLLKK